MPHDRFFSKDLSSHMIELQDAEFHHLAHVMRIKENETIELIDGNGTFAIGFVEKVERSKAKIAISERYFHEPPQKKVSLAIALPKFSHLEFVLEKATELGCDEFILFPSDHSEKMHITDSQKKRIELILISAIKQCGRLYFPKITFLQKMDDLEKIDLKKFYCHLGDHTVHTSEITKLTDPVLLLIGPEKGWSLKDVHYLEKALQAIPITLGPFILRMETACIAAAAIFMQK